MRQVCPRCALDDFVSRVRLPNGNTLFTCSRPHGSDDEPYVWEVTESSQVHGIPQEGLAAELGLFDSALQCLNEEDGWTEYGVIEERMWKVNPEALDTLRKIYGHTLLDGSRRYSMSIYIARHVLGGLEPHGEVRGEYRAATGKWRDHNATITFWTRTPVPPKDKTLTYAEFRARQ